MENSSNDIPTNSDNNKSTFILYLFTRLLDLTFYHIYYSIKQGHSIIAMENIFIN